MTKHQDVEQLLADAINALAERRVIANALAALPDPQRRHLEAHLALELLQRIAA